MANPTTRKSRDLLINQTIIATIELRDLIFKIGDEQLIRSVDLLIYALGSYSARSRIKSA